MICFHINKTIKIVAACSIILIFLLLGTAFINSIFRNHLNISNKVHLQVVDSFPWTNGYAAVSINHHSFLVKIGGELTIPNTLYHRVSQPLNLTYIEYPVKSVPFTKKTSYTIYQAIDGNSYLVLSSENRVVGVYSDAGYVAVKNFYTSMPTSIPIDYITNYTSCVDKFLLFTTQSDRAFHDIHLFLLSDKYTLYVGGNRYSHYIVAIGLYDKKFWRIITPIDEILKSGTKITN